MDQEGAYFGFASPILIMRYSYRSLEEVHRGKVPLCHGMSKTCSTHLTWSLADVTQSPG